MQKIGCTTFQVLEYFSKIKFLTIIDTIYDLKLKSNNCANQIGYTNKLGQI